MYVLLIGVAKKRFNTSVFRKLKNVNATPNTPALNNEKPNCPGKIKSMVLYWRITATSLGTLKSKMAYAGRF